MEVVLEMVLIYTNGRCLQSKSTLKTVWMGALLYSSAIVLTEFDAHSQVSILSSVVYVFRAELCAFFTPQTLK